MKLDIVYQTGDFIIIYKPCGISVHKDQSEIGLTTLLAEQFGVPQVWLVHRLDKVTSGLLILALNAESAAEFFRLFSEHHIQKTYLALSNQKPKKKQGLIVGDMQKARNGAWKLCQSKENPAITRFKSVSCEPNLRLFTLKPQTGKTHQLRVAMKSLASPILGDALYGKTLKILTALIYTPQDCNLNLKVKHLMCLPLRKKESGGIVRAFNLRSKNLAQQMLSQRNKRD